jgi:hypothetical protein
MTAPSIIETIADAAIFAPHFRDRDTWQPWWTCVRAIFGLPMPDDEVPTFRICTGREEPPGERASEAWIIVGRRGGKSRVLALIASYLAAFVDWSAHLAPGERGYIVIVAADRRQCRTIMNYIRAFLKRTELLADLVERDTAEELELSNGLTIEVATCSYRTIRGRTVIAALCDEAAFWSDDDGANPASEVIASLRPAMATIPGALLLVASSPYWKRGPLYEASKRYFGKPGPVLVWKAATRTMNPNIPQSIVDEAFERDPLSASAEWGGEFRNDVDAFVARDVIDALVIEGCKELAPVGGVAYSGFCDPSGGSSDSFTAAVAHMEGEVAILDAVREWRAPFSPESVVTECAAFLKTYHLGEVTGDRYAGEWPRERFKVHGIEYHPSTTPKSDIYRETLPHLNAGKVELLDVPRIAAQFTGLERRVARGGRDSIDHAPNSHDDVANSVAGVLLLARRRAAQKMSFAPPIIVHGCSPFTSVFGDNYAPRI